MRWVGSEKTNAALGDGAPEGEAEGATAPQAPFPKSRKARKYVDRKAPKANFLSKVRGELCRRVVWRGFAEVCLRWRQPLRCRLAGSPQ